VASKKKDEAYAKAYEVVTVQACRWDDLQKGRTLCNSSQQVSLIVILLHCAVELSVQQQSSSDGGKRCGNTKSKTLRDK
jgi:hypothetical protein